MATRGGHLGKPARPKPQRLLSILPPAPSFHIVGVIYLSFKKGGSKKVRNRKETNKLRRVFFVTFLTFLLTIFFSIISQLVIKGIGSLALSFLFLLFVIFIGIAFDIVGTAAAAASIAPLNAKAAKRVSGAKKGVFLVQNADLVSNICNDVVGDIAGVVSGVIGAYIIFQLALRGGLTESYLSIVLTGLVAALTVGGKAIGKTLAINRSDVIILLVGKILNQIEKCFFIK